MGCQDEWEWEVATGIVKFPLALLITIIGIHGIYLTAKKKKSYKWMSITTVIFFTSSATFVLYATSQTLFLCFGKLSFEIRVGAYPPVLVILGAFQNGVYGIHYCTLIIVLFTRVKVSFDGTSHSFSANSSYFYKAISCFLFVLFVAMFLTACTVPEHYVIILWIVFVSLFCSGLVYQSLFFLFVSKLKKVLRNSSDGGESISHQRLQNLMIKNVLLSSFSFIGTALWLLITIPALLFATLAIDSAAVANLYGMAQNIDVFVNCLCIYLTMNGTASTYDRYCGRLHAICSKTCCGMNNDESKIRAEIELQTVHSEDPCTPTNTENINV